MNWYYAINHQRHGPVSAEDFESLVRVGTISPDTLVWREGLADWLPYAKVAELPPPLLDPSAPPEGFSGGSSEEAAPTGELNYASFGRRFLGAFLDGIVNVNIGFGLTYFWTQHFFGAGTIMMPKEVDGVSALRLAEITLLIMLMNLVVQMTFIVFFFARFQATLGMLALRIKLVRADGSKVSVPRIIGRHFATILSFLILLIGYLMAAFDAEGRTLHDRLADTRVVNQ